MRTLVIIPFSEATPAEIKQYEEDPAVKVVVDGDRQMVIVEVVHDRHHNLGLFGE